MSKLKEIRPNNSAIDARYFERTWVEDVVSSLGNRVTLTANAMTGNQLKDLLFKNSK